MLIELPSTVLDLIKEYTEHPDLRGIVLNSLTMTIHGFLSLFIIIYDVWAHHRVALKDAVLNRTNLSLGIFVLFLCSLTPPLYHVLSVLKHLYITNESSSREAYSFIYWDTRLLLYVLIFTVYGSIAIIATKDLRFFRRRGSETDYSRIFALKQLKDSSTAMVLITLPIGYLSLMGHIPSPGPIVMIALCTHLPIDKLMHRIKRRVLPNKAVVGIEDSSIH